jgi:serine O-acetyltransferase
VHKVFKLFRQDAQRWVVPQQVADPSQITFPVVLKLLFNYMPLRAMLWFRFGSWCAQKRIPLMKGIVYRHVYRNFGLEISPGADVGGGLYIAHTVGCVISAKKIGQNCSIISNVTIGMRNKWEFPEIGDDVFIGAGARILGGIRVGNGAIIGANAVVIQDVPDGTTAAGVPARIIHSGKE